MTKQKVKIYIDGSNTFHAQKKLGWRIDWLKVRKLISQQYEIIEFRYYAGVKDGDLSMKSFLKYLGHVGIQVLTKPLKKIKIPVSDIKSGIEEEKWIYKANFDVEITVDILLGLNGTNKIIIFSGDSDFIYLASRIKIQGRAVEFITSRKTVAWEIRKISGAKVMYFEDFKDDIMV